MRACATCTYSNLLVTLACVLHTLWLGRRFLMESTFDERGLNPWLLTHKPSCLDSVHPNNDFSGFTFNTTYVSFFRTFTSAFRSYVKAFLLLKVRQLCPHILYWTLQRVWIFSPEIYLGCYIHPEEVFGTCTFPK